MPPSRTQSRPSAPSSRRLPQGPRGGIELLLIQAVEHLGEAGDVVEVKRGYALNYLLPQGLATLATDHHKRMVEKHRARLTEIQSKRLAGLRKLAEEIEKLSVTIEANATDEGHLYGSVGPADIASALKRHDIKVSAEQVRLAGPLKELGLYTVKIHVAADVESDLKVWVVPSASVDAPAKS